MNNDGRTQALLVDSAVYDEVCYEVFRTADANDFVQGTFANRVETVWRTIDFPAHRLGITVQIQPGDVRARCHYRMHIAFGQAQNAADHMALFLGEGDGVFARMRGITAIGVATRSLA